MTDYTKLMYQSQLLTMLITAHNDPARHYHTWAHLQYLSAKLGEYVEHHRLRILKDLEEAGETNGEEIAIAEEAIQSLFVVAVRTSSAIQWHDFIYNIWSPPGMNEAASAVSYQSFTPDHDKGVYAAIVATGKHLEDQEFTDDEDGLVCKLMLDVDLSAFGDSYEVVQWNQENIFLEQYPKCKSERELNNSTITFLNKLLERKRIFYTDYFFEKLETKARENIARQILDLEERNDMLDDGYQPPHEVRGPEYMSPDRLNDEFVEYVNHAGKRVRVFEARPREDYFSLWRKYLWHFDDGSVWWRDDVDGLTAV